MPSNDFITQIQAKADLLTIASRYIVLVASRRSYRGTCPFHNDQSTSLMISPDKNIFKCFGCGIEGGPVEFVMAIEQKSHADAVTSLASHIPHL